ncbi:PDZ/DHR/GLGF domain protein, partial [Cooperia oncophora]
LLQKVGGLCKSTDGPEIGFGFVAAGQHPTVIQFVSAEGPSEGLLFANDQILAVNGVDVQQESKDNVVALVRSAEDVLELTVEQLPARPRSARRSCRVRFTDRVLVASMPDGSSDFPPPLPNALRVYLENGQTRSFRYDDTTTVKDILNSIFSKLQLRAKQHFALAIEYSLGARSSRVSLLRPETKILTIVRMPNSDHLRCVFRFAFIPKDIEELWMQDPRALDYYYQQCTSDVVRGRYAFEMRYEACVRLAALHMQQVTIESNLLKENNTVSLTRLE